MNFDILLPAVRISCYLYAIDADFSKCRINSHLKTGFETIFSRLYDKSYTFGLPTNQTTEQ